MTSISGSRSAAMSGGRSAFRIAITAAATSAPPKLLTARAGNDPGGDEQRERDEQPRDDEPRRARCCGRFGAQTGFSP